MSVCLGIEREHEASVDPRRDGECVRCGKAFTPKPDGAMVRDQDWERQITRDAGRFAQYVVDSDAMADALSAYTESRTGPGPWRDFAARDWTIEAAEEVADLRAYLCAAMLELDMEHRCDEDADRERMLLMRALAAAVEAYDALMLFRQARKEL